MCYSAQIEADYRKYVKMFGAQMDIREFARLYWERAEGSKAKIPKAMDDAFAQPQTEDERQIKAWIDRYNAEQATKLEQDLFKQRSRLADAERLLQTKVTKAATESKRIASDKIDWTLGRLDDLRRTTPEARDSRIFPGHYAPVLVVENGQRVIKPMRYQCRIAGKPASYDVKFPGTYNARRDNLEGFWKPLFGASHGLMLVRRSTRTSAEPGWKAASWQKGRRTKTSFSNSNPTRKMTCWLRACGPAGRSKDSPTCCRSPRSRTSHLPKWPRRVTTVASCRSNPSTSTRG